MARGGDEGGAVVEPSPRGGLRELADARSWTRRAVAIPGDLEDPRRPRAAGGLGALCPGDVPDRGGRGVLSARAGWMDARRRRRGAAAPDLSLRPGAGLHL